MNDDSRQRPSTMKDIAHALGVTVTTVSKSMRNHPDVSPSMRDKVLEEARRQNYVMNTFARSLRSKSSPFVPVLITDIANPYFADVIAGTEPVLRQAGYEILIFDTRESADIEASIISKIIGIKPVGVLLTPAVASDRALPALRAAEIPYVLTNRYLAQGADNYVVADDMRAAYLATEHLIRRQSSRVVFINGSTEISCAVGRFEGYRRALSDNGIAYDPACLYPDCNDQKSGYAAAKRILDEHQPPFSILAYSDFVASGVLRFALEKGLRIPEDVAIIGIDNTDLYSFAHPSLSTVDLDKQSIGRESANLLLRLIRQEQASAEQVTLPPNLVLRESA